MRPLTQAESKRLIQLEKEISAGKEAWKTAGRALIEIRDGELYCSEFETFWDYCAGKWGWKKRNVNTVISSYEIFQALPPSGQNCAHSANQAREMGAVDPAKLPAVIDAAQAVAKAEGRDMTARDIKEAAKPDLSRCAPKGESVVGNVPDQAKSSEPRPRSKPLELPMNQSRATEATGQSKTGCIHGNPLGSGCPECQKLVDEISNRSLAAPAAPIKADANPNPTKRRAQRQAHPENNGHRGATDVLAPDRHYFGNKIIELGARLDFYGKSCIESGNEEQMASLKLQCEALRLKSRDWVLKLTAESLARRQRGMALA